MKNNMTRNLAVLTGALFMTSINAGIADAKKALNLPEVKTVKFQPPQGERMTLSNGITVRLLGIKQNPAINGKATEFLMEKLKGKKVFLRYDTNKYDSENHLLVYMYLENKTFINAHLLKNKLVLLDDSFDYKYKNKFQKL